MEGWGGKREQDFALMAALKTLKGATESCGVNSREFCFCLILTLNNMELEIMSAKFDKIQKGSILPLFSQVLTGGADLHLKINAF